ncbi:MAG TPA: 3-methyl-2-oxobutanoate dehydrogenase subunit VorB [Anaerolineaceae bacterium]|jgi:2-oxoglutarate ferredoxin oxidoreductase subunit alpha|nr:3-methyl-2-oxobutanoate dehydrogenase subunit VorB [Anaerolineaceae bacterium]NMD30325.1 3-methyl-2-oxobutanoate dehydrogenase subunit VorB [Chloroflexota bacterium]HNS63017.1 3-methyl-2-oxobutanoate dehydrogenase subunit VorB [Anaerolineaceae bacterium]HNZ00835.1 3-methyl-2-oxobutanoate dehydrogenase subunit VorB [Anaerolineaceae bacterium]HOD45020.1 3-methyl-2-oxobutanoate dehydrogenase subunit VorB [Anaerolineaceae bacterium]
MARQLMKGNEAVAEAAVRAGLHAYFGYPITPQTELLEYLSRRMPELGRAFVQAESEVAAINMVYGAACTGSRVMTSSSSPGFSLMMEGVSYMAATEIPVVMINVMRGGPGLGNISPSQADYNQSVHGGGHGDYRQIVLTPGSVQESVDLTVLAFDLAEKYRINTVILSDGSIGQMMEPCELPEMQPLRGVSTEPWAITATMGQREHRMLSSIYLKVSDEEKTNIRILNRWRQIEANEVRFKEYYLDDADFAIIGFGSAGRVALTAVRQARAEGIKVGLLRPITVAPFPVQQVAELSKRVQGILVTEMNGGQMLDDVLRIVKGNCPVEFFARLGGVVPFPDEILSEIHRIAKGPLSVDVDPRSAWLDRMAAIVN